MSTLRPLVYDSARCSFTDLSFKKHAEPEDDVDSNALIHRVVEQGGRT